MANDKESDSVVKTRTKSSTKGRKRGDPVEPGDPNSSLLSSPVKSKGTNKQPDAAKDTQPTLDKHLKQSAVVENTPASMSLLLKEMQCKLDKLASQEYIEKKFKEIITKHVLAEELKKLKQVIKEEIKKEIDKVSDTVSSVVVRMSSLEDTIEEMRNKISDLELKTENLETENVEIKREKNDLKGKIKQQSELVEIEKKKNNDLEQYTRRNTVRFYGIADSNPETDEETCRKVISLINDKLKLKISIKDIDIAHRIGQYRNDGNRVVICKFVQRMVKMEVLRARRAFKGSVFVVREDLTRTNAKLLEAASQHGKVKNAWSDEGKIFVILTNRRKFIIKNIADLDAVSVEPSPQVHGTQDHH